MNKEFCIYLIHWQNYNRKNYKDKMQENKIDGAGIGFFCILWFSGHNFFTWVDGNKILEEFLKGVFSKPSGNHIVAPNFCFLS